MKIQDVFHSIRDDLEEVENVLHRDGATSKIPLLTRVGTHILSAGGKRFRPALTLLCGRLGGSRPEQRIPLAASIELIHNATLLHDDIVDQGTVRRGRPAAHTLWGDPAGVLAANFHFSRAFSLVLDAGGIPCLRVVIRTLSAIAEGELLQFLRLGLLELDEAQYRDIIDRKTARLISSACQIGGLSSRRKEWADPFACFGLELGMAFQLMDDLLDYTAREELLGKKVGTDFREAKFTLPLILAFSKCRPDEREDLLHTLREPPTVREERFPWARELIERYGGFADTHRAARLHVQKGLRSLSDLPQSREREALQSLASFVVERQY
ncbi:MAG: polyprenyl synthetase family protein [bacterium]